MKYRIMNIKRALFILFLCVVMSGCWGIYREKYYEPVDRDAYTAWGNTFLIDTFENWMIELRLKAYSGTGADPKDNNFDIKVYTSTFFNTKTLKRRDTAYRASIKSVRILHGENLEDEIDIGKTELTVSEDGKYVSLNNEGEAYIPSDIKTVLVIIETEFIDRENNITEKKFAVPMKRKEYFVPLWYPPGV